MELFAVWNAIPTSEIGSPPITSGNDCKRHARACESIERILFGELGNLALAERLAGACDIISAH
jgi:hypothetical protein